jgi:hypothetical protein
MQWEPGAWLMLRRVYLVNRFAARARAAFMLAQWMASLTRRPGRLSDSMTAM